MGCSRSALVAAVAVVILGTPPVFAQPKPPHDSFYWLGEINKASAVINTEEGLLDRAMAPKIAAGLQDVLADGNKPDGQRPSLVITFEPLLIRKVGVEATLLHAGRSSQDMLATVRDAIQREQLLKLAAQLTRTTTTLVQLAEQHADTIVPNYTNGVAAQPNSYGHYLLGHVAGLERDAQRLQQAYARLNLSPMGTTVLNGTSWPLNRERMARYLGFPALIDNAYDAAQIHATEMPIEIGAIAISLALHVGAFIQDVSVQYAEPQPWILLREGEGNTYVSSAMPQKRNPGLLINTRTQASKVVALGIGRDVVAHNVTPGMNDPKVIEDNLEVTESAVRMLATFERVLKALTVNPERALDELNSDWTASQEIADVLMRKYRLPFRVGHHFASEMVTYAKDHDLRPSAFPYEQAVRLYAQTIQHEMPASDPKLPMSEAEFRATLDPKSIIRNRRTIGGPQPAEMTRMLRKAQQYQTTQGDWVAAETRRIDEAIAKLDADFDQLAGPRK